MNKWRKVIQALIFYKPKEKGYLNSTPYSNIQAQVASLLFSFDMTSLFLVMTNMTTL